MTELAAFEGRVRGTDPDTSWSAAEFAESASARLKRALLVILGEGAATHGELHERYLAAGNKPYAPQRIRTATAELHRGGLVIDTGERRPTEYGRPSTVWRRADDVPQERENRPAGELSGSRKPSEGHGQSSASVLDV